MAPAWITQHFYYVSGKPFLNLTMPRDRLGHSRDRVLIPIVLRTVSDQLAAKPFDFPNQVNPLHDTTRSSTLRILGICPLVKSA